MARLRFLVVFVVFAGISAAGSGRHATVIAQQMPVYRSAADAVTVDVSVRRNNRPVTGLTIGDFEIADNGVAQTIGVLSYEKLPIDVTVLLDVSGSVTGAVLDQLRRAVDQLRQDLQPADRLRLMTFNMRIQRLLDPSESAAAAMAAVTPGGSTALFDAVAVALAAPDVPERRQLIALFSDGFDSSSITPPAVLLDVARRTSPTVSVVLADARRRQPHQIYTDLAEETGGVVVSLAPTRDLGDAFRSLFERFRSSYVLQYTPTGVSRPGAHTLDVRVKQPGVEVRARRGYVHR